MAKTMREWLESGQHLPGFLRDFHDQKDVFKSVGQVGAVNGVQGMSWAHGHCYVIDVFLPFMAKHGYTLQRSRAAVQYDDLSKTISDRKGAQARMLMGVLGKDVSDGG